MATHVEDVNDPTKSKIAQVEKDDIDPGFKADNTVMEAQMGTVEEHNMKFWDSLKNYRMSVFWSFVFSTALIMEGFDHAFITGFFAFPRFKNKYGHLTSKGTHEIPAAMQSGISNGVAAGEVVGLLLNSYLSDRFGYRWVMIGALFLMICFIFLQFFAKSLNMYLGAEILLGVPWGVFQALTTTYASEVSPLVLRKYLTILVSFCWSLGYLLGSCVLRGFLQLDSDWAYRIPFALQWAWPVPLSIMIFLAPESPWWLVRRNKIEDAKKAVLKLLVPRNATEEEKAKHVEQQISMMIHTDNIENELKKSTSLLDCFKGVDLRRTEITITVYIIQNLCSPLFGVSTYFLEQAGMSTKYSFDFTCIQYALAILGVIVTWFIVSRVGRRPLYVTGVGLNSFCLFITGFLGIPNPDTHKSVSYGVGAVLLVQYFIFFVTVAPMTYTLITEVPSNRLRSKSVNIARAVYNVVSVVMGQLNTRMVQNAAWGWGAKTGFFWGGIMLILFFWSFFRVPETANRTFAETDILFNNRVPARKFKNTGVDLVTEQVFDLKDASKESV